MSSLKQIIAQMTKNSAIDNIVTKFIPVILSKDSSVLEEIYKIGSDIYEFTKNLTKYLDHSYEAYKEMKSVVHNYEPRMISNSFEVPNIFPVSRGPEEKFNVVDVQTIIDYSNFSIIRGTGGSGKSTLLKYLFLETIKQESYIPLFIELNELNNYDLTVSSNFIEIICEILTTFGSELQEYQLIRLLESGKVVIFLDGYDELKFNNVKPFVTIFGKFCKRFPNNNYILTSRPNTDFSEFQRFAVFQISELTIEQSISLIKKLNYSESKVADEFIKELNDNLYNTHKSFASNPLLLTLMLINFAHYRKIPEKIHIFYQEAFDTLYRLHDSRKPGMYSREFNTLNDLPKDVFMNTILEISIISYLKSQTSFKEDELIHMINEKQFEFDSKDYIDDLISICIFYREGNRISFVHKTFQEYFSAKYLEQLSDIKRYSQVGEYLINEFIKGNIGGTDILIPILYALSPDKFEKYILNNFFEEYFGGKTSAIEVIKEKFDYFNVGDCSENGKTDYEIEFIFDGENDDDYLKNLYEILFLEYITRISKNINGISIDYGNYSNDEIIIPESTLSTLKRQYKVTMPIPNCFLSYNFIYQIPLKHEIEENILEIIKKEVNYKIINSAFIVYDFLKEKQKKEDISEVNNIIDSLDIGNRRTSH
ncbi:NACHT domain-containing protein [Streptococcus sp.]